jgi:hypothetical protein
MKLRIPTLIAGSLLAFGCSPMATDPAVVPDRPSLIRNGELTGGAHPAVVLVLMEVAGRPAYTCSGTLIAPRVVLTAGHCVGEPGEFSGLRIFTESDVENGDNSFPFAGKNSIEATAWHAHPQYTNAAFFLHDVGVIRLATPVVLPAGAYGQLPAIGSLDALRPRRSTTFTSVGYGTQRINPAKYVGEYVRMFAQPHLLQINGGLVGSFSMMLSNNASSGGTCFGDSGGPNFLGSSNVIAGVTSFGLNGTCGGTGGVFRLDQADVRAFVNQFLE